VRKDEKRSGAAAALDAFRTFCHGVRGMPALLPWLFVGLATVPVQASQAQVDPPSLMTTPVLLMNGQQQVSLGTGFFFGSTTPDGAVDTVFLVTNYHVVTGHAPGAPGARAGDHIQFFIHEDPNNLTHIRPIDLPLYRDDGEPVWVTSTIDPAADVVLVPVPPKAYAGVRLYVFTEAHTRGDIKIRPTSGATLLGYPYGFYDTTNYLPVWKTGHVASEPDVDFDGRPVFLVDVSAFPGMSGSPVLAVANGVYESEDGVMRTGRVLKLLGIFSAMPVVRRAPSSDALAAAPGASFETSLQLGYVWKASIIAEMARKR
jgi:Trypsin-like peptidase domain